MTDVLAADALAAAAAGSWARRPAAPRVAGVGTDTREDLAGRLFVALRGPRHDGHAFLADAVAAGAAAVMVEDADAAAGLAGGAGVLRVDDTVAALGRLAAAHRDTLSAAVVAITGTAGKTTTKALVHAALRETHPGRAAPRSFNNAIGVPLTLLAARPDDRALVVEIGTNAPGEVDALAAICRPDVAVITLVGHGHLEGLGDLDAVAREKLSLLGHARGAAVLNADCPHLREARGSGLTVRYGTGPAADVRLTGRGRRGNHWWFEVDGAARFELPAPGAHLALNALAAVAVARHLGVPDPAIRRGLAAAELPPMRLAIESIGGARVWNDAWNANPESMRVALAVFAEEEAGADRRILVLGDMLELGPAGPGLHRELADDVAALHARRPLHRVILVGPLMRHAAEALAARAPDLDLAQVDAPDPALLDPAPGDAILLKGSRGIALERLLEPTPPHPGLKPQASSP